MPTINAAGLKLIKDFESKVEPIPEGDGCWEWVGFIRPNGYGQFGRKEKAHRASFRLNNGQIPDGMCVLHRCDNRSCVNPKHLFLGTQTENIHDMNRKGRGRQGGPSGERAYQSKLTDDAIAEIRSTPKWRGSGIWLAKKFDVTPQAICYARNGKSWRHLY